MEQPGNREVQCSVCVEMAACAAAASDQFFCKSREEPNRKPCDCQHKVVQGQTEVT